MARQIGAGAASPVPSSSTRRRTGRAGGRGARIASRSGMPRDQVNEIQRSRLLAGALAAIEEHGYAATTVAQITARSRISRRTFYELFENCEACLAALVEGAFALLEGELAAAGLEGLAWRERVRGGLHLILAFCDREPALARVCVVEALHGGPQVQAQREAALARFAVVLGAGRWEGVRSADCSPLTAEGLVGATLAIVHARLLRRDSLPLTDLLGELMGMIVLPYLGAGAARREQARPAPKAVRGARRASALGGGDADPLQALPMRVTYRTARVLQGIAERPGISNRAIADYAGIHDQGQISKLLARLQRLGLAANGGEGHQKGEPNAWSLTALGEQVAQRLQIPAREETDANTCRRPARAVQGTQMIRAHAEDNRESTS
jgi:AcrR family transcriptional regulator